jgi:hypothetical protein
MENHPVISLVQKINAHYKREIETFLGASSKKRTRKLYLLIVAAKNNEQLDKELLFKKLFGKTHTVKNDYEWRHEIRVLKQELEKFLVENEHRINAKNNPAYNNWLLIHGYERIKHSIGVNEVYDDIQEHKDVAASYQFAFDADIIKIMAHQYFETDVKKMLEQYPMLIQHSINTLDDLIAQHISRINSYIAPYNSLCNNYQNTNSLPLLGKDFSRTLPQNSISNFNNHYANSFTPDFDAQIGHLEQALKAIETIADYNKSFERNRVVIQISLARELSAGGFFLKAHEIFLDIKTNINKSSEQFKTLFYVNYITNMVKSRMYAEALQILDNEFETNNLMYKNMLLQSRLLCYLFLRDTDSLSKYISYDLDAAPFPQNYMLKVIKSAYFCLMQELDVAQNIISNLMQTKDASDRLQMYLPIVNLYKKFYAISQKTKAEKKWNAADVQSLKTDVEKIDSNSETKHVSIYQWVKNEIGVMSS